MQTTGDDNQTKWAKFAGGFVSGAVIEFAAYDNSYPCANDLASLAGDGQMMYYIYNNRVADDNSYQI